MTPRRVLLGLFGLGVLILAIGAAIFFAQFPHTSDSWSGYAGDVDAGADWSMGWPGVEGDLRGAMAGAAIAGVGFLVILVPIVASGVWLGRQLERSAGD